MPEKILGKIEKVRFGFGGYQDVMLGLSLVFDLKSRGVSTFVNGGWIIERNERTKWTEEDRMRQQSELCAKVISVLRQARVSDVGDLVGMPVEVTVENNALVDWRILTEVL